MGEKSEGKGDNYRDVSRECYLINHNNKDYARFRICNFLAV